MERTMEISIFQKIVNFIKSILFVLFGNDNQETETMTNEHIENKNVTPDWRNREIISCNYLKEKFGNYGNFELRGGADSEISDIFVTTPNAHRFYIDCKKENSQCSQFVVRFNKEENEFQYGYRDRLEADDNNLKIVSEMNKQKEEFKSAGTRGKKIEFEGCQTVFRNYLTDNLFKKNIRYIICGENLIPVEKIGEYFDIKCCYRQKKSGSRNIPKKDYETVIEYLTNNGIEYEIKSKGIYVKGMEKGNKFNLNDDVYYVSNSEPDGSSKLRILSKTANSNVIFSLKLKKNVKGISDEEFITFLRNN